MFKQKFQHILWGIFAISLLFCFNSFENLGYIEQDFSIFASTNLPDKVILGGSTIGFVYDGDGVIVLSNNRKADDFEISGQIPLKEGDIIYKIDDEDILCCEDVSKYLNQEHKKDVVTVYFLRDGQKLKTLINPILDPLSNSFKLGVWAKDDVSGLGTLTYVNPETGYFGSLGHPLTEGTTGKVLPVKEGGVYDCNILGISKGAKGVPGELKGMISRSESIGNISKNADFGIFGTINDENILNMENLVEIGGRKTAKPGYAQIYTSVDNEGVKAYDIQIIKTNYQSTSNTKSMVLKVTDKNLLEKTGGIVQGMSGSPIVQDGKLIGAVTHVFTNDSSKGFGVYIDWML